MSRTRIPSSTVISDVAGFTVRAGSSQIWSIASGADSSPTIANTGQVRQYTAYRTATSSATHVISLGGFRAAGTGVVTFSSTANTPATLLVEDMRVA